MDFISWNFILYLLAGLLIWVPVFLLIPFPLRSEGKWLITAVSFLLALLYLAASQVMPLWQSVLVTALLLGMAAYFIQQKGAKFLAAEGQNHADEDLHEESFYEEENSPYPEFEQFHIQNHDVKIDEDDTINLEWLEEEPDNQGDKLVEDEKEADHEPDWYIEEAASSDEEYPYKTDSSVPPPSDPEILEEWFENHSGGEEEAGSNPAPEDAVLDALDDRSFLNELLENSSDLEKEEIFNDHLFTEDDSSHSISEEDAVLMEEGIPTDAAPDFLTEIADEQGLDVFDEKEKTAGKEAELTEEEMKVFASWFEEDAKQDDLTGYDLDMDVLEPLTKETSMEEDAFEQKGAAEEFDQESASEKTADEQQIPDLYDEDIKEITDTASSGEAFKEEELVENPLGEPKSIQKAMPDELLEVLYNQLLELKETSLGYEFNAIMDNVLTSSKGIREYFVFVQLYLTYLEEQGQEIEFQNVYIEAMEHLESYPYLKEQLSWTKKQQQ